MHPLAQAVYEALIKARSTLAVAESCTGGMIGAMITAVPGSSKVFYGGVISYSNEIKESVLGVPADVLLRHGAVSAETVEHMAIGVQRLMKTTCSVSVSGIAGPDGATPDKPVGLVYIGVFRHDSCASFRHVFAGDREQVRTQAVEAALTYLLDVLANYK